MITSTNKEAYPNTLIVILGHDEGRSSFEEKEDVTRVTNDEGKTIGYNFFNVDKLIDFDKLPNGPVKLSDDELEGMSDTATHVGSIS